MATRKSIKLTYDIEKLFEDFATSRGLSEDEQIQLTNLKEELQQKEEELNSTIEEFNPIKMSAHAEIMKFLAKEKDNYELLEKYIRLLELTEKVTTGISNAEINELSKISSEISTKNDVIEEIKKTYSTLEEMKRELNAYQHVMSGEDIDEIVDALIDDIGNESIKNTYHTLKADFDKLTEEINTLKTTIEGLEVKALTSEDCSLERFVEYLQDNKLSTVHAEEIYNAFYNSADLKMTKNSIKIRKGENKFQPIRDQAIKKGLIPTAVTSAGIGGVVSTIVSSGLPAGSKLLGIIPVMSSQALTTAVSATIGIGAGLVLTPVVFYAKGKLTKAHYKFWYKNAESNLNEYENETAIEDLPITKLMLKIEKTKHKILELNNGNWFTKALKFIPKHILNAVNRNRLHHVEAYTQDLFRIYANRQKSEQDVSKIHDLIETVETFVDSDSFESKLNAMLTCKEKGKHTHRSTIENIDIYANLKITLSAIAKQNEKSAKATKKNLTHKKAVATDVLNNGAGFTSLLGRMIDERELITPETESSNDLEKPKKPDTTPYVDKDKEVDKDLVSNPQPRTLIDETKITRSVILDRLKNDEEFKKGLISKGYTKGDVKNLIRKLTEALESGKRTSIKPKTNYGKLYIDAIDTVNKEKKLAEYISDEVVVEDDTTVNP